MYISGSLWPKQQCGITLFKVQGAKTHFRQVQGRLYRNTTNYTTFWFFLLNLFTPKSLGFINRGNINVYTKLCMNPFFKSEIFWWIMVVVVYTVYPASWISVPNFILILEIFQSKLKWWANQDCHP